MLDFGPIRISRKQIVFQERCCRISLETIVLMCLNEKLALKYDFNQFYTRHHKWLWNISL
jgi:hypothetical protein